MRNIIDNKNLRRVIIIFILIIMLLNIVMPITVKATEDTTNNFKFNYKEVEDSKTMSHILYTPSTANKNKKLPLIVWLHGSGEVGKRIR